MRKMIKNLILKGLSSFCIAIFIYIVFGSKLTAMIVLLILLLLIIIKPALLVMNKLTQRTNWYKSKVGDGAKFCRNIPLGVDVCNLGSNSGKYAFDYGNTNLKGENWAMGPQTLSYDFRVLKNYFSYLKEGATVLIPLCPFSGCIKDFEEDEYNYKYYPFLHPILILNYSQSIRDKVLRFVNKPFEESPIKSLFRIIKDLPRENNMVMDDRSIESNSLMFVNSWKQQFLITDLDFPVSEKNRECITYNTNLLKEMISFCIERNLKPVIVIPPMTKILSSKFSETFRENYIYSFIREANTNQVVFLNYLDDERFMGSDLYFNSYFLNQKGRKLFTNQVLNDLGICGNPPKDHSVQ